jgi:hypothetical protein
MTSVGYEHEHEPLSSRERRAFLLFKDGTVVGLDGGDAAGCSGPGRVCTTTWLFFIQTNTVMNREGSAGGKMQMASGAVEVHITVLVIPSISVHFAQVSLKGQKVLPDGRMAGWRTGGTRKYKETTTSSSSRANEE